MRRLRELILAASDTRGYDRTSDRRIVKTGRLLHWIAMVTLFFGCFMTSLFAIGNFDNGTWTPAIPLSGMDGGVRAMTEFQGKLVVAGDFSVVANRVVNGIASWDGTIWSDLAGGFAEHRVDFENSVRDMCTYNGQLVLAGNFKSCGGVQVNGLAAWDGNGWSKFGGDVDASGLGISEIVVLGDKLIANGVFAWNGGLQREQLAEWNGTAWREIDINIDTLNYEYINNIISYHDTLIAVGFGRSEQGIWVYFVRAWDGVNWNEMGTGLSNTFRLQKLEILDGELTLVARDQYPAEFCALFTWNGTTWNKRIDTPATYISDLTIFQGRLHVAGIAGIGSGPYHIMIWDEATWSNLASSSEYTKMQLYQNRLFCSNSNYSYSEGFTRYLGIWGGQEWDTLGMSTGPGFPNSLCNVGDQLILGGHFSQIDGEGANCVAAMTPSGWDDLNGGVDSGGWINKVVAVDNQLVVGGAYWQVDGVHCNGLAKWDGSDWSAIPTSPFYADVLDLVEFESDLIISRWEYGGPWLWDGTSDTLESLSPGGIGLGTVLAFQVWNGKLYAGGELGGIWEWDASTWSNEVGGLSATIMDFEVYHDALCFVLDACPDLYVVSWNGNELDTIGIGSRAPDCPVPGQAPSLPPPARLEVFDDQLILAGAIVEMDGYSVDYITSWNGTSWSNLGTGLNASVTDLLTFKDTLFAVGPFIVAGGIPTSYIAKWSKACAECGDFSGDCRHDITDAVHLVNYIFAGGPVPTDQSHGDINCDQRTNITDIVVLINFLFSGGPAPCAGC